jgi:hypothetical protein
MTTVVTRTHVRYIAWLVCSESNNELTLFGRYNTMFFLQTLLVAILNITPNYRCEGKSKFVIVYTMRSYSGNRNIAALIRKFGTRWR